MRVKCVGDGDPTVAVVACIHGDEVCGKEAMEQFLSYVSQFEVEFKEAVKFVVANEEAVRKGTRSVGDGEFERDLNRVFSAELAPDEVEMDDLDPDTRERRIAAQLLAEVDGLDVLDLHSTVSYDKPIAFVHDRSVGDRAELARATGVPRIVDTEPAEFGTLDEALIANANAVSVECGIRGTQAAVFNAHTIVRRFLAARGVLNGTVETPEPTWYDLVHEVRKEDYVPVQPNFASIDPDEPLATRPVKSGSDRELYLEDVDGVDDPRDQYVPILMSADGYADKLGYIGREVGAQPALD